MCARQKVATAGVLPAAYWPLEAQSQIIVTNRNCNGGKSSCSSYTGLLWQNSMGYDLQHLLEACTGQRMQLLLLTAGQVY